MDKPAIPTFAVLGHPNEGKSSVVSTLTEDDSVRISPFPGETTVCRHYPVTIDGREILRFVDTPGFQQPRKTLEWLAAFQGPPADMAAAFIAAHKDNPDFSHETELFSPLAKGAGIVFVVDGSRPLRRVDIMEMEILRLTGLPRMAVINTKEHHRAEFLDDWKHEARKHFNTVRLFDAHRATCAERIDLLESLKHIDPEWQPMLQEVIAAFKNDWQGRINRAVTVILDLLAGAARHVVSDTCGDESQAPHTRTKLETRYRTDIQKMEKAALQEIRKLFKHNLFDVELPPHSIVNEDLFSKKAWHVLGLGQWQLAAAGAAGGGILGANIDLALAGHSLGAFTAIGGLLGGGSAIFGARRAFNARVKGLPLGRLKVEVGPVKTDQMLFILLDRALIYFSHVSNWAHSRREPPLQAPAPAGRQGITSQWEAANRKEFARFFAAARKNDWPALAALKPVTAGILGRTLQELSERKIPLE
ncbi:GTPase/DUF3482 domain-containing protein [Desulfosudis oleivorans]|uniref:GTP-binding protein HSR1-related n=1 Tax=Desulfosudis oleivorans (strain DSM 6200 / JCM 39069 / Hxd3) TaxID=96561 RepID=A8ZZA1_DESOH|nr:GTPase/DUF3482 domain-containing protein [Desulfosudis oleivorans]ABW67254.1 GTP-binding protein HSR1-related [Desulfosudis oleivorans Hxd3]